jgi:hypothetical protein
MTIRQYEDYIHSLTVSELRALSSNGTRITFTQTDDEVTMDENYLDEEMELRIQDQQNYAVAEQQALYGIEAKMQQTGLTKAQILTIEHDKTQATLSEIMLYCKGLKIPYSQLLPELYIG